jgi:hypothetical protein
MCIFNSYQYFIGSIVIGAIWTTYYHCRYRNRLDKTTIIHNDNDLYENFLEWDQFVDIEKLKFKRI